MMKLTVLGSGTCIPLPNRNAPGYFLQAGGLYILVDCGSGVARQLAKAGYSCETLDCILLTHLHPDHCSDLVAIVHALKIATEGRRKKRLTIGGPAAIGEYYRSCVGEWVGAVSFPVKLVDMQRPIDFDGVRIDCHASGHLDNGQSKSYRFTCEDKVIVFTGDAPYSRELAAFATCADLVIADCSTLDKDRRAGHMSAGQCGVLAREAGARAVMLSHLYPDAFPDQARADECRREFAGEIVLAEDLMEYEVGRPVVGE